MKEFIAEVGGRKMYADDILNLQEIALSSSHILEGHGDFVISGCEINNGKLTEGYAYINGKILKVGTQTVSTFPQYIYSQQSVENVSYADGETKNGRRVYSAVVSSTLPNGISNYITVDKNGPTATLQKSWFGETGVVLNPDKNSAQTVNGPLTATSLSSNTDITCKQAISIENQGVVAKLYMEGSNAILDCTDNYEDTNIGLSIDASDDRISANASTFEAQSGEFSDAVTASSFLAGNVKISEFGITTPLGETGQEAVTVNLVGYQDGTSSYRNFVVGDGKGNTILKVSGKDSDISVTGTTNIKGETPNLTFTSSLPKTNNSLKSLIKWVDSNNQQMAYIGFASTSDNNLQIKCGEQTVTFDADGVNMSLAIKENGVLLTNKYATISGGVSQFIKSDTDKSNALNLIGGISKTWESKITDKTKNLSDLPDASVARKNLGIEVNVTKNTDWIGITLPYDASKSGPAESVYFKQMGDFVCIKGHLTSKSFYRKSLQVPDSIGWTADIKIDEYIKTRNGRYMRLYSDGNSSNDYRSLKLMLANTGEMSAALADNDSVCINLLYMI